MSLSPEAIDRVIKNCLDPVHRMEKAAVDLMAADPTLDRATAIVKAYDADPELGQRYNAAMSAPAARPVEKADENPAWAALNAAADDLQERQPLLDRATAIVKAADIDPALAQTYQEALR